MTRDKVSLLIGFEDSRALSIRILICSGIYAASKLTRIKKNIPSKYLNLYLAINSQNFLIKRI